MLVSALAFSFQFACQAIMKKYQKISAFAYNNKTSHRTGF